MCKHCDELDHKISRYCGFLNQPFDSLTKERIKGLIRELEERKNMLHESP